jgi:DNA mismatch endonuclease (patch repair protein)
MDIVNTETRSRLMAGIRSKNTKPEMTVRRFLHAQGFRYRLHERKLPGRPDIVLPRYRVAIMVQGCFWHQHAGCKYATVPSTREETWLAKFDANQKRDQRNVSDLVSNRWNVILIWECGLRPKDFASQLTWLPHAIRSPAADIVEWPIPK